MGYSDYEILSIAIALYESHAREVYNRRFQICINWSDLSVVVRKEWYLKAQTMLKED